MREVALVMLRRLNEITVSGLHKIQLAYLADPCLYGHNTVVISCRHRTQLIARPALRKAGCVAIACLSNGCAAVASRLSKTNDVVIAELSRIKCVPLAYLVNVDLVAISILHTQNGRQGAALYDGSLVVVALA